MYKTLNVQILFVQRIEYTNKKNHHVLGMHNPTDFASPNRLSLFALLTAPWNPNLTLHIVKTYKHKNIAADAQNRNIQRFRKGSRIIQIICPSGFEKSDV